MRFDTLRKLLCGVLAIAVLTLATLHAGPSQAQQQIEKKSLIELLFGGSKKATHKPQKPTVKKPKKKPRTVAADVAPVIVKSPTAKTILVIGDFMAKGLGDGLATAYEANADIAVTTKSQPASGLVRIDAFDWVQSLPADLDKFQPSLVIIMLGANDRQSMKLNGERQPYRSPAWTTEYEIRITNLIHTVTDRKIPVLWVGLPAFASDEMTADMVTLNAFYRKGVELAGGEFVDIWDGFVDDTGKYLVTGSDINGQQVRLRNSDGIGMTKAGKRKLAYYVEKPVMRLLGTALPGTMPDFANGSLPDLVALPPVENVEIVRTQPIGLLDPELDGGSALLGDTRILSSSGKSPRDQLILFGNPGKAPGGRLDDFRIK